MNDEEQTKHFELPAWRRAHIQQQLDRKDCSHETSRFPYPEILVVTKRDRGKVTSDAWTQRCREAQALLLEFDLGGLARLLGSPSLLENILSMQMVITDQRHAPLQLSLDRRTLVSIHANATPSVQVGQKRKAVHGNADGSALARKRPMVMDQYSDSQ